MLRRVNKHLNKLKRRDLEQLFGLKLLLAIVSRTMHLLIMIQMVAKSMLLTAQRTSIRRQLSDVPQLS